MMLGVTMRMTRREYPGGDIELRDAIACDWTPFLELALPHEPHVFLPNSGPAITAYAERIGVSALLLTGGDDWGVFPRRDETERELVAWATEKSFPILGVCRGAQVINRLMGGSSHACARHAGARHNIALRLPGLPAGAMVNSFHNHCIAMNELAPGLEPFALAGDGGVEGFYGRGGKICGIIWHPEREKTPATLDLTLISDFFGGIA